MRRITWYFIVGIFLIGAAMSSCKDETIVIEDLDAQMNRNYSFGSVVGRAHISIEDILTEYDDDNMIEEDENGILYRAYSKEFTYEWFDVLKLDDISETWTYAPLDVASPAPSMLKSATAPEAVVSYTEPIVLNDDEGVRLDSMYVHSASMTLTINVPSELESELKVSFPEITKDGEILSFTLNTGSGSHTMSQQIDVEGVKVKFSHSAEYPNGYISLVTDFISVAPSGVITGIPDPVEVTISILDISPEIAFGDFGETVINEDDIDLSFDILKEYELDASIEFYDYFISLESESNVGAPFSVTIGNVNLSDTEENITKSLILKNNVFSVDAASYDGTHIVPAKNKIEINRNTSNIAELGLLSTFLPDEIKGNVKAQLGANTSSNEVNFICDTSKINSTFNMRFPLWLRTSEYCRLDTIEFNYNEEVGEDDDEDPANYLNFAKVNFNIKNGLPLEASIQVYLIDENKVKVDSLFNTVDGQRLINAAPTNADGLVTGIEATSFTAEIHGTDLEKYKKRGVRNLVIKTCVVTSDGGFTFVKVTKDNTLDISLSVEASGRYYSSN